jgi:hypothetical protein
MQHPPPWFRHGHEDVLGPMKKGGLRRLFMSNGLQADDYSE